MEKLSLLSLPTARVIRDGAPAEIPTQDLVEEDVIELEAGRQVCAAAVLLTEAAEVNESLLTGESDPVRRSAGERLLSGSFVVSGRYRARVEHVGRENYAARIAQEAKALRGVRSELLTSMRKVTRFTGYWIPFLGVLLFLEALFLRGETKTGIGLVILYGAAALSRQALEPRLVGKQVGLNPVLTLLALYTGYRLLGVGGMIVFPIAAMLFKQIWDHSGLQPEG